MIAKATTISHGSSLVHYLIKEAKDAQIIFTNGLTDGMGCETPQQIWECMKHDRCNIQLKNDTISVVISPSVSESRFYTKEDWEKLAWDFLRKFDEEFNGKEIDGAIKRDKHGNPVLDENGKPERYKKQLYSNLCNSQILCVLHTDSGTPHLQMAINRVDRSGKVNSDSKIGMRASRIANMIAAERNLVQAEDISLENKKDIERDIRSVLNNMNKFDWEVFKLQMELKNRDYQIQLKKDSKGVVRGWTISINKGETIYKGSDIGRKYSAGKMPETWKGIYFSAANVTARKQIALEQQRETEKLKRNVANKPQVSPGPVSRPTGRPLHGGDAPSHGQNREWEVGRNYNPDDPDNQIKQDGGGMKI